MVDLSQYNSQCALERRTKKEDIIRFVGKWVYGMACSTVDIIA